MGGKDCRETDGQTDTHTQAKPRAIDGAGQKDRGWGTEGGRAGNPER